MQFEPHALRELSPAFNRLYAGGPAVDPAGAAAARAAAAAGVLLGAFGATADGKSCVAPSRHGDTRPVGSTRSQSIEPGAAIDRGEPAGRPCGSSGAHPAQKAVSLQAGDVRGLFSPADVQVVVGCHFTLLSVWGLEVPKWAWSPKPCRRLQMRAVAQGRGRHFSGSVPLVPLSVLQILRVLADGNGHPLWAPVQTDVQQCMAPSCQIACLRCRQQPPSLAGRRRASRTGRRRGSAR